MKKRMTLLMVLILSFSSVLISKETNLGVKFCDAIMDRYSPTINNMTSKGWEYSNSIVLCGMIKIYEYTQNPDYLDYIQAYVDKYVDSDGDISFDASANNLDHLHPGLLLNFLYEETGLEKYKLAAKNIREEFDNQPRNDSGGFWHKEKYANQMWADGIYMAEPFLIQYGALFDDMTYAASEVDKQVLLFAEHAYDSDIHLIYHGWDETKSASWADDDGRSPCVWSRGMGWYCMALVDIMDYLPETDSCYNEYITLIQGLAQGIKENQDADTGLWFQVVDQGSKSDNWTESSGSGMFVYMLQKALRKGFIDSSYVDVIDKGWEGMQTQVSYDSDSQPKIGGFVGSMGIQTSYSNYVSQSTVTCPTSKHPHGYCAILSVASVMEWPKDKIYSLSIDTIGNGGVVVNKPDTMYMPGRYVKLTARPNDGESFAGWSGDITSSTDTVVYVKMDESKNVTATFTANNSAIENTSATTWKIYPNPVVDVLSVQGLSTGVDTYKIMATDGRLIKGGTANFASGCNQISVVDLAKGVYLLQINNHVASFVKK